jgi:hypothetical protein
LSTVFAAFYGSHRTANLATFGTPVGAADLDTDEAAYVSANIHPKWSANLGAEWSPYIATIVDTIKSAIISAIS